MQVVMKKKIMRDLYVAVPPGIGDFSWCWSKLKNLGRRIHVVAVTSHVNRLKPFVKLLPGVASFEYRKGLDNNAVLRDGNCSSLEKFVQLLHEGMGTKRNPLPFQLNTHLEEGHALSCYLPDTETSYHFEIDIPAADVRAGRRTLGHETGFLAVYMSSISMNGHWDGWDSKGWARLIDSLVPDVFPNYVIVGAQWDEDMSLEVEALTRKKPCRNLVGKLPYGQTIEVLRNAAFLVGFPSGVPITAYVDKSCPTLMLYPKHLDKMRGTYVLPNDISMGRFQEVLFCSVEEVSDMVRTQMQAYAKSVRDYQ